MIVLMLLVVGLSLGSFVNAYVWRVYMQTQKKHSKKKAREGKYSLTRGRSMCPHCEHTLAAKDLVPVLSWLQLGGKCRYCKKSIGWQYPAVELLTGLLFVVSYLAWPSTFDAEQWVYLVFWLAIVVNLVALAVYDLKWMLLPNRMLWPLAGIAVGYVTTMAIWQQRSDPLTGALWGALIGGGLFYVLFQVSDGKWIGGGDVKLGAVLGIIVGGPMNGILLLFLASLLGTIVSLPLLMSGRAKRTSKLPFGPFLITAAFIVGLYGQRIIDWYNSIILV